MKNTKHSICLEQMGRPKSSSELVPVEAAKWTPKLEHVCMKSDSPSDELAVNFCSLSIPILFLSFCS